MSALLAAARLGDPVAHTASKGWMMAGLIAGALIGAAAVVVTGGAALTLVAAAAAGAAAGGGLGEVLGTMSWAPRHVTGSLISGSFNVFVNGRPAVRAHLSQGICSDHPGSPQLVAQGSSTVFINGQPAARMEDMLTCSAVISAGSPNVFIGGATVTTDDISPEIPGWVNWTMLAVGVAAAAVLAGPLVAALGTVGGIAGGEAGSWLGGKFFGDGSDGQKWSMLGGSLLGGLAGAKGANAWSKTTGTISAEPNRFFGARGPASGREFDPTRAGGPIRQLSTDSFQITHEGIDAVQRHVSRFGQDNANDFMVNRLRNIADGNSEATQYDKNFYTHELTEFERYTNLGWEVGQPTDPMEAYDLWNNTHTATLEDFGLKDGQLYHPDAPQ
ncbi:PAAR domain-containing protein [Ralstonia pseudosolanacearum]|uniref:PAAR domain-containing protein n=1 Tax=Ralstonia solanacearum TaxID=305 RepID=A0A0S4WXZ7_RALSL|nr:MULTISPECIES: PAAR domain-containing protein [Ralstonia]UZF14910.1 PAAR domain-containing protein [Ralstonia solanacearum]UZF30047.1 PAAR domain-containing protein [Ralstonia sp. RS650]CUV56519.1 putative transmembrane protein [Ralstonia solanacearum]